MLKAHRFLSVCVLIAFHGISLPIAVGETSGAPNAKSLEPSGVTGSANHADAQIPEKNTDSRKAPKILPEPDDGARKSIHESMDDEKNSGKSIETSIREGGVVVREGVKYLAFPFSYGTLLVPATGKKIKPEDFDGALCT